MDRWGELLSVGGGLLFRLDCRNEVKHFVQLVNMLSKHFIRIAAGRLLNKRCVLPYIWRNQTLNQQGRAVGESWLSFVPDQLFILNILNVLLAKHLRNIPHMLISSHMLHFTIVLYQYTVFGDGCHMQDKICSYFQNTRLHLLFMLFAFSPVLLPVNCDIGLLPLVPVDVYRCVDVNCLVSEIFDTGIYEFALLSSWGNIACPNVDSVDNACDGFTIADIGIMLQPVWEMKNFILLKRI